MNSKMSIENFQKFYSSKPKNQHLPTKEALHAIWEHEKKIRGIDWLEAEKNGNESLIIAINKAQKFIERKAQLLTFEEKESAKKHGILDNNYQLPQLTNFFFSDIQSQQSSPSSFPDDAVMFPCWGWNKARIDNHKKLRGSDVEKEITNLVRNFQVMENSDEVGITKICMEAAIYGFGGVGITAAFNIIRTLVSLTEATEAYAVMEGIVYIGVNVLTLGIAVVILAVLVPLMILMNKDAFGLFVLINNTSSDLVLQDITFTHGKCVSGFKENVSVDNPKAIIPSKFEIYNPNADKTISAISAGFLGVRKKDNALIGTRGALKFYPTSDYPDGIYLGWEVPLSQGDNRILVSANYKNSLDDFSNLVDESGTLDSQDTSSKGNIVEAHMNDGSGSKCYSFVIIN